MINLLPLKNKEEISGEKNWKIALILSINLLLIVFSFSLILYSINVYISGKIEYQEIIYQQTKQEFNSPETQTLIQNLQAFNQTFDRLDYFYQEQFRTINNLKIISENIPPEIYLTNLLINPKKEEKITECVLTGFSPNRQTLLEFKEKLEKNENFQEIYFPSAIWLKSTDMDFTINFKIKWQ